MCGKKMWLVSILTLFLLLLSYNLLLADQIDDILRIWQDTVWNWGKRIFWFFGVAASIVIAASPDHRKKALYVLGGVVLFYLTPLIVDVVQQAAGRPF